MQPTLERGRVLDALKMVLGQRHLTATLVHHSDRGSQYASGDYQVRLAVAGIRCSMSRKGDCFDNAPVESFFSTLKTELVYQQRFATRQEARRAIFDYVECDEIGLLRGHLARSALPGTTCARHNEELRARLLSKNHH